MYPYPVEQIKTLLKEIIARHVSSESLSWIESEVRIHQEGYDLSRYAVAFVQVPRKTGKKIVEVSASEASTIASVIPGFSVQHWAVDQLVRVWLLLYLDAPDEKGYEEFIEKLFLNAEMNELVALYAALPTFAWPERWRSRCAEGIRSNIGKVLEAIMCNNPYPAKFLDEPAWNQLVLKAIFTDKPLLEIYHLKERSNQSLANSISGFAHERWAAHRNVNPLVWICVEKFVDEKNFQDIERLAYSTDHHERQAAALVCSASDYAPAKALLKNNPELGKILKEHVTWNSLQEATYQRISD